MTGAAGTALCVVCEEYDGDGFPPLVGAKAQMDRIVGLLEGLGYEARKVGGGNPSAKAFDDESEEWSSGWLATGDSKPALIIWSGHGVRVDGETRLVLSDLKRVAGSGQWKTRARRQGVTADDLVSVALDSGAEHVLLIIDTCYAGGGAVPALGLALSRWEEESAPPGHAKWLGFLASCQSLETSDGSGPLLAALTEVLKEGPAGDEYRSAWSAHNALVSGPDLLDAIATRWEGEGQTPVPATLGEWRPAFPNPRYVPEAPARLVEHLVQAARGVGHLEEGWFFTGRTRVLGRIVEWLDEDAPGLFLVTGPAGCGKSAVLGRIATLADPEQRERAVASGALRDGDPDPGVRAERTLATVHLRDLTPLQASERLARALDLPRPRNTDDFRAEVRELSPQPVLVIDGLDEVPAEHTQSMIEDLVFPLSRTVPVLLGSRERPFRNKLEDNESLVQALARHIGAGVEAVDLEEEPHTREDIGEYVRRRCEQAEMAEGPAREVGAAISERATDVGGGFLFARLVTSTVLARVASGEDGSPLTELPDSIDAAFENELRAVPARVRDDGTVLPSAAWDLLTALAWTVGQGMPAGGVWEAVAGALGGGVVYDETDVDWALSAFGRYIVEDAEEGQAVYRLYHREFVSHLRRREGPGGAAAGEVVLRTLVDLVKQQGRVGDWSGVDPYVTRGLVRHAVRCGGSGVEVLRGVVAWDEGIGLPYLARAVHQRSLILARSGEREVALNYADEAVGLYQELEERSPHTHLSELAGAFNSLANRLADAGDRARALAIARKALRIRRDLAEQHPAAYLPDLAGVLNNLANHMAGTGDRQGALGHAREAVRIRRDLAAQDPAAFLPDLAASLHNLANRLAATGDRQGAVSTAREATHLYQALSEQHPAAFRTHFAGALNNLANHLASNGDVRDALTAAHESVLIRRDLAAQHPAAYLPDLAGALNNLANRLAETGDRQRAVAIAREATDLYQTLAEQHPAAFLPDLAGTLNNLANHLAHAGDRQGAVTTAREATDLYQTLAEQHPAAFLPDLATSRSNLASHLAKAGDHRAALSRAREALSIRRDLAEQDPAAFLPDLAGAVHNLANRLAATGDRQGAVSTAREATALYRALSEQHPAAFLSDLGTSLNTLAIHLAATGENEDALTATREALTIRRDLAGQHPAAFLPELAGTLNNLANHLAISGDQQGAVAPAGEATTLYRALAEQDPAAFLPDLAGTLNNLASHLAAAGDHRGALSHAHEALRIRRALAQQHPGADLPQLALSLRNLANHLANNGDRQGAVAPASEATNLYRALAEQHPAAFLPGLAGTLNDLANHLADTGDITAATRAYEQVIRDLSSQQPTAGRALTLEHSMFLIHRPEAVEAWPTAGLCCLVDVVNGPPTEGPDPIALRARHMLRAYAGRGAGDLAEVTTVWQERTSTPPPAWLALIPGVLDTVAAWLATSTWSASRDYWAEHHEVLSSPEAGVAVAEYALAFPDGAADHQVLRASIHAQGAARAYEPRLSRERITEWAECGTWEESEQFLRTHPDLLDGELPSDTPPLPVALLRIASTHDIPTAYALVRDRTALQQYVDNALTTGDAQALRHAAAIEDDVYADQLSARTHHQAALLLGGTPDEADPDALAPLVADASPDVRNRLISEAAALSAAHAPQHAAQWARVIQVLASPG
ncbi:tetratricopeptide repeat protein [Streptomyces sp. NBC_00209]|uniref:tetratricopeptide repeat protein n=1 Tax=Streptomyces sp. NBC_00209 TaxID=2975682 RepID=UPI00324D26FB